MADSDNTNNYKHFEVVPTEANDHHFLNPKYKNKTKYQAHSAKSFQTTIIKEWKILDKNLPDAIYVRGYETRTDLLRAVIVGAPGTPYHDGLFFFDIFLPQNYPSNPPLVYYHSHGYRLNPNLYKDGLVCLSLLNTWSGSETELWSENATLLQLLVSIQGLVLNEKPYYNEPGFGRFEKSDNTLWINQGIRYNERVFIMSCKTLLHIVKQPPEGFEGFVVGHFRGRAAALQAKVEGSASFKADLDKVRGMISSALAMLDNPNGNDKMEVVERKKRSWSLKHIWTCWRN